MIMQKQNIFLLLFSLMLCACNNKSDKPIVVSNISVVDSSKVDIGNLLNKINDGDTAAYNEAFSYYIDRTGLDHFLFYALKMANQYHYPDAYFHVYFILTNSGDGRDLAHLDKDTYRMAIYNLLKAYEMENKSAIYEVKEIFKNKSIPKSATFQ